jgi:hypothetical protein
VIKGEPTCPRCGRGVRAPSLVSNSWQCDIHGVVHPLQPITRPSVKQLDAVLTRSQVPVWLPWPLPTGWVFTGVAHAGDERGGARATAVACTGPSPLGGPGELILVAEEMGVGLGARYAGLDGADPGPVYEDTAAHAKLFAAGRPTAMWCVPDTGDRAVFVGEARGLWLWAIMWPEIAGHLIYEEVVLTDLRDAGAEIELLPIGALSPRLRS